MGNGSSQQSGAPPPAPQSLLHRGDNWPGDSGVGVGSPGMLRSKSDLGPRGRGREQDGAGSRDKLPECSAQGATPEPAPRLSATAAGDDGAPSTPRTPLFVERTQRTRHGVGLSEHDDFEQSIARIDMYFHPRFHADVFFVQLVRNLAWPLSFLYTHVLYPIVKCATDCASKRGRQQQQQGRLRPPLQRSQGRLRPSLLRHSRGLWRRLLRFVVYVCMFIGLAEWLHHCHHSGTFDFCRADDEARCR